MIHITFIYDPHYDGVFQWRLRDESRYSLCYWEDDIEFSHINCTVKSDIHEIRQHCVELFHMMYRHCISSLKSVEHLPLCMTCYCWCFDMTWCKSWYNDKRLFDNLLRTCFTWYVGGMVWFGSTEMMVRWRWTPPMSMTWEIFKKFSKFQAKIKVSIDLWNQSLSLLWVGTWNLRYCLSYCCSTYWNQSLRRMHSFDKFRFLSWWDGTILTDEYLEWRHETFWKCCT